MNNLVNDSERKLQVLLTGFDAFSMEDVNIDKNTSGEAVKLIKKRVEKIEELCSIDLFAEVIPVQYEYIDTCIPDLWNSVQPHLSIHVGVSDMAQGLTLEKVAEKGPYTDEDAAQFCPPSTLNPCTGPRRLATDLCVDKICEEFNNGLPEGSMKADISEDAGKYVCEYIYYTSMALYKQTDRRKASLFVHVPWKTQDDEIREISNQLERLLMICVKHMKTQQHD